MKLPQGQQVKSKQNPSQSIGQLAEAAGTKVETIRYYERIGLLDEPQRTSGNYRAYSPDHLARLSFIRRARDLGFTLDQVRTLIGLADRSGQSCDEVDAIARSHLVEVDRKIADLRALKRQLTNVVESCGRGVVEDCKILEALSPKQQGTTR